MSREKGKKTEHLHLVLSPEEKRMFRKMARERSEQAGERYTVTRLVKEKVLSGEAEKRELYKLRKFIWNLQKLETDLRQQEARRNRTGADCRSLLMIQEKILTDLSLLQQLLKEGGG